MLLVLIFPAPVCMNCGPRVGIEEQRHYQFRRQVIWLLMTVLETDLVLQNKILLECHRVTAKRKLMSLVYILLLNTCYPFPDVAGSAQGDISWRKA